MNDKILFSKGNEITGRRQSFLNDYSQMEKDNKLAEFKINLMDSRKDVSRVRKSAVNESGTYEILKQISKIREKEYRRKSLFCRMPIKGRKSANLTFSPKKPTIPPKKPKKTEPIEIIKSILRRDILQRTDEDLIFVHDYLCGTKLADKFKKDKFKQDSLDQIFLRCAEELKLKTFREGHTVFRINEEPDFFYIVLKGKVDILKPIDERKVMSGLEYFQYLYNLKIKNDLYLLELTIFKNKNIFPIEKEDIKDMNLKVALITLENFFAGETRKFMNLESIIEACFLPDNFIDFEYNDKDLTDTLKKREIMNILFSKLPKFSQEELLPLRPFSRTSPRETLIVYSYSNFLSLGPQTFFGDSAIDAGAKRNATIVAATDVVLATLDLASYTKILRSEKNRIRAREVAFLLSDDCVFRDNQIAFERNSFGMFICEEASGGDKIVKEYENAEYAYFIREGTVEISVRKSLKEMEEDINKIGEGIKEKINNENNDGKIINGNKKEIIDDNKDWNEWEIWEKRKGERKEIMDDIRIRDKLKKIEKIKLKIVVGPTGLCFESFFFEFPYLYSLEVKSRNCLYYKIRKNDFMHIMEDSRRSNNVYSEKSKNLAKGILQRMMELWDNKVKRICEENERNQNEEIEKKIRLRNLTLLKSISKTIDNNQDKDKPKKYKYWCFSEGERLPKDELTLILSAFRNNMHKKGEMNARGKIFENIKLIKNLKLNNDNNDINNNSNRNEKQEIFVNDNSEIKIDNEKFIYDKNITNLMNLKNNKKRIIDNIYQKQKLNDYNSNINLTENIKNHNEKKNYYETINKKTNNKLKIFPYNQKKYSIKCNDIKIKDNTNNNSNSITNSYKSRICMTERNNDLKLKPISRNNHFLFFSNSTNHKKLYPINILKNEKKHVMCLNNEKHMLNMLNLTMKNDILFFTRQPIIKREYINSIK